MTDPKLTQSFTDIINELNDAVQMKQPDDILQFCSDFFLSKLAQKREHWHDYKFHHDGKSHLKRDTTFFRKSMVLIWRAHKTLVLICPST